MFRALIVISLCLSAFACVSTSKSNDSFIVRVAPDGVSPAVARKIALYYLSRLDRRAYDGKPISVRPCTGSEDKTCDYRVFHSGNGCGWGAFVVQHCSDESCRYDISDPDLGPTICE